MKHLLFYIIAVVALAATVASRQGTPRGAGLPLLPPGDDIATAVPPLAVPAPADSLGADSLRARLQQLAGDSIAAPGDSLANAGDTTRREAFSRIVRRKVDLEGPVRFSASDSLVLSGESMAYLYGSGNVQYGDFKLESEEIRLDLDSATVYAYNVPDSTGNKPKNPVFSDKGTNYESESMKYNFKTQRGFITGIITEQQDGFITGGVAKKMENGDIYLADGKYTTCDDHEHPHFYFQLTKSRVRPQKDVVTGPAYMVLADVPLPLALPFGYFPFSKKYSSGIIFPSFGEDYNRGFYMRNGGYYFAFNDNVDLALLGELYTKGSWGLSARSNYVKRYKFRGSFSASFLNTVTGERGSPDYVNMRNFQVLWSHSQDAKANPALNFSASVNFATTGYSRNDLNSYYNSSFTENTKSSSVNLTYRKPGSKWSFSVTGNIAQRTADSTLAVSLPSFNVSLSQIAPFKRKKSRGGERWYEKIKLSYSGQFQNSLTAKQDEFFKKNLIKDWRNGMRHSLPVSATFSLFKYLNLSPSININDRMYTSKIRRQWDTQASREIQDTTYGFYNIFDFNVSVGVDTKLYGFYQPLPFLGDKVQMIRHVLTPTVSFSYQPDFGAPMWGIHDYYMYTDQQGNLQRRDYSYFNHGIFGVPSRGKSGSLNVSLANNVEMKVKSDADSTGFKKISLIENLSLSQSYNFAADSLRLSPLQANILLRLVKNFNLNLNTTWDPYTYGLSESGSPVKVNKYRWEAGKGLLKLSSASTSFSYTFNNATFRRNKDKDKKKTTNRNSDDDGENTDDDAFNATNNNRDVSTDSDNSATESDYDGYAKWECPWSLSVNYSVSYGYGDFNYNRMDYKGRWNQSLSFNGNIRPTKNWNFSFSATYNFDAHKITYMNCSISRDLHCFTMSASFVPLGPYKSYNFHIAVKSSLLKDLKYDKRSSTSNGIKWY